MRTRSEPVHISEPLSSVWLEIERAYCRAHGLPLDIEPGEDETPDYLEGVTLNEPCPVDRRKTRLQLFVSMEE